MRKKRYLIVIVGPTAVGKTSLSIKLAQKYHTEILSADSRQIYKELNIGTDTPSENTLQTVPHHFINEISITENFSAGDFEVLALKRLEQLYKNQQIAIVAGGSGLYIKALLEGFNTMPEVPKKIREKLNAQYQKKGLEYLQKQLKEKDPVYYKQVDLNNHKRLIRALEIIEVSGAPYSKFRQQPHPKANRPFNSIKIGLHMNRKKLYKRINQRVDRMVKDGLIEEARTVYPHRKVNALNTVGYKELFDYFENKFPLHEAIRLIKRNSRRFAKRQLTWFRQDRCIHWFRPNEENKIFSYIEQQLKE